MPTTRPLMPPATPYPPPAPASTAPATRFGGSQRSGSALLGLPTELWDRVLCFVPRRSELRHLACALPGLAGLIEPHAQSIRQHELEFEGHAVRWVSQVRTARRNNQREVDRAIVSHRESMSAVGHQVEQLSLNRRFDTWRLSRGSLEYSKPMYEVLADILQLCPHLSVLNLANNNIMVFYHNLAALDRQASLTHLDLSKTKIDAYALAALGAMSFQLESFRCFDGIELGRDEGWALLRFSSGHPNLKTLQISVGAGERPLTTTDDAMELLRPWLSAGHKTLELLELNFTAQLLAEPILKTDLFPALKTSRIQLWPADCG